MDSKRLNRLHSILEHSRSLDPAERAGYVEHACANDAPLRREVEFLLHETSPAADPASARFNRKLFGNVGIALIILFSSAIVFLLASARHVALVERDRAETQSRRAAATLASIQNLLLGRDSTFTGARDSSVSPDTGDLTASELLKNASRRLESDQAHQPDIQASLHNTIGNMYGTLGTREEARAHLQTALDIRLNVFGPWSGEVAESRNDLGLIYASLGQYDQAAELYRQAYEARKNLLGPGHPDTAATIKNMAVLQFEKGRLEDAEALHSRVLEIRQEALGRDHPDVAESKYLLGWVLYNLGRYEEALRLTRESLDHARQTYGDDHTIVASRWSNLSIIMQAMGDFGPAVDAGQRALEIRRRLLGDQHDTVATSLNNLGFLYQGQDQFKEAERYYREALALRRKMLPANHPDIAQTLGNLGGLLVERGILSESELLLREALQIQTAALQPDDWRISQTRLHLGRCLIGQQRFREAGRELESAYSQFKLSLGESHPRTRRAIDALLELYTASNQPEKAAEIRAKLNKKSRPAPATSPRKSSARR